MILPFQSVVSKWPTEIFLSAFVFFLTLIMFRTRRKKYQFPPGPRGWPFFGIFFDVYNRPAHLVFAEMSKKHGKIFTANILGLKSVILSDVETVKEAMLTCQPKIDSKSEWRYCFIELLKGISVMPYNQRFINTRRRAVSILREYGMGKSFFEPQIYDETKALIANILRDCDNGKANIEMKNRVRRVPVNIICKMLFNERYDYDDSDLLFLLQTVDDLLGFLKPAFIHDSLPKVLQPLMKHTLKEFHEKIERLQVFLKSKVTQHEITYKDGVQRDFIDAWIRAQKQLYKKYTSGSLKRESNNNKSAAMKKISAAEALSMEQTAYSPVVNVLQDVFIAGAHSSGFAINWMIMLLTLHKDVQDEVYEAIIEVLGTDARPTIADRPNLPIVEAVIYETLRVSTLVPLVGHGCATDVTLCGYRLPKKAEVTYNNWEINHNEENFPNSHSFLPKRWIKEDGSFDREATANFFPFGIGKRSCAGETLAKMELFIIATTLFQNLEFLMPDSVPDYDPEISHFPSFVMEPKPYLVRVKPRHDGSHSTPTLLSKATNVKEAACLWV